MTCDAPYWSMLLLEVCYEATVRLLRNLPWAVRSKASSRTEVDFIAVFDLVRHIPVYQNRIATDQEN